MLNVAWKVVKLTLFALLVLTLGSLIHIRGRTVSDQIRTGLSQAERSVSLPSMPELSWPKQLPKLPNLSETAESLQKKIRASEENLRKPQSDQTNASEQTEIAPSERQKLRALIRDLNRSHSEN
jgi:hypothetical protein